MFELFLGLEVRERKLYRNQKLHLKVLLKIKCLKAVSRFSLSYREKQKQLKLNPLPLDIIFFPNMFLDSTLQILQSSCLLSNESLWTGM